MASRKPAKRKRAKPPPPKLAKPKRKAPRKAPRSSRASGNASAHAKRRDQVGAIRRAHAAADNDVLPLPPITDANALLAAACREDFGKFCREMFAAHFVKPFSRDHRTVISKIEDSAIRGGLFALGMPRGSGKTTLLQAAGIWTTFYAHRRFVVVIGPEAEHGKQILRNIKAELRFNDRLHACFPAVCHPIRCLEGKSIKCNAQHAGGVSTRPAWTNTKVVLPALAGSPASGAIVSVTSMTGQIRGKNESASTGDLLRPDFVIVDDFQTPESARSLDQCRLREGIILADILELAGPGVQICGVLPCTVIEAGDVADRLLDRDIHPEFRGERMKTLYAMPSSTAWWDRYADVLRRSLGVDGNIQRATELYVAERAIADEGAVVAWPERFKVGEASAIQSAMNVWILKPDVFAAEYQNEPVKKDRGDIVELPPAEVAGRINRVPRKRVPLTATRLTAFIDVQGTMLYFAVCAWEDDFTGYIIDYGTWPNQERAYFTLAEAQRTFATALPKATGLEGQIYGGLGELSDQILGVAWQLDNGTTARVERCLIDAGWGDSTNVVFQFCRQSAYPSVVMPSKGFGIGAGGKAISERAARPGERKGLEWYMPLPKETRGIRQVNYDTNFWKSFVHGRMGSAVGSRGSLSLFGDSAQAHRMFADHFTAEFPDRRASDRTGRTVVEWFEKPNRENHWLDCAVGAAVAASVQGVSLQSVHEAAKPKVQRQRMTLAEMKAAAQNGR